MPVKQTRAVRAPSCAESAITFPSSISDALPLALVGRSTWRASNTARGASDSISPPPGAEPMQPSEVGLPVDLLPKEETHTRLDRLVEHGKVAHLGRQHEGRVTLERQDIPEPYGRPHTLPLNLERPVGHESVAQVSAWSSRRRAPGHPR